MFTRESFLARYLKLIIGLVALLVILSVGCTQPALNDNSIHPRSESTPTNSEITDPNRIIFTPTVIPTLVNTPIEIMVPYTKTSFWNTPIGPSPKYDPHSDEMIATLVLANSGKIITAGNAYNYPVYFADADTPRWDIPCTIYKCVVHTPEGGTKTDMLANVPIPPDAQPSADTDARMIVIDRVTYAEYDFWRAQRLETGWTTGGAAIYNILWSGTPTTNSSRGSGIPSYAGLLRPWEVLQGRIEHVLAFGYTEPPEDKCVFPASRTDGDSMLPFAIPEGARLQLDPSLTEEDFDQMGLDRAGKIIARALQEYGMISVDHSGSFKLYLEDLTNNPYTTQVWTDPGLNLTKEMLSSIPYTSFRVLELPPGYWDPSAESQYHAKCFTFPGVP